MSAATSLRVRAYVTKRLGLWAYLRAPGDGRRWPVIPAEVLLWAQLIAYAPPSPHGEVSAARRLAAASCRCCRSAWTRPDHYRPASSHLPKRLVLVFAT